MVLIHGTDDRVVRPPNADRIVDQWLASRDAAGRRAEQGAAAGHHQLVVDHRRCIRTRWYTAGGRGFSNTGGSTASGTPGPADRAAPSSTVRAPLQRHVMWTFFPRHRLPSGAVEKNAVDDHDLAWDIRLG